MTDLTIRSWHPADAPALRPLIADCLAVNRDAGADMEPTEKNVTALLTLGLLWASQGEPTLVAERDGQLIGYILWGRCPNPLDLDLRDRLCSGLGTYVVPVERRRHVASALRLQAMEMARARGYARVQGVAYHEAGRQSVRPMGFREVAVQVEVIL